MTRSTQLTKVAWALVLLAPLVAQATSTGLAKICAMSIRSEFNKTIKAADFGAKPDDGVDDTEAIQSAINSLTPGSRLVFERGTYEYSKSLIIRRERVALAGSGATLHATSPESQALIVQADDVTIEGFTLSAMTDKRRNTKESARLVVYGASTKRGWIAGTVFRNNRVLPVDGQNSSSSVGIFMSRAERFLIEENEIRRTLADGIHITGGSRFGLVRGNTVAETGDDMIAVVSYMGKQWRHQQAENPMWIVEQAELSQVHDVIIENNRVSGQYWGRGISVVGGRAISIVRNKVANTTQAAGILVAHEDVYNTFGAKDILIQDNEISDVQTLPASFMPSGMEFTKLHLRRASGLTTGHGAIEIHSLAKDDEPRAKVVEEAISIDKIAVMGNQISRTKTDGIRIGISTPGKLIGTIALQDNHLSSIAGNAVSYRGNGEPRSPIICTNNFLDKKKLKVAVCVTMTTDSEVTKGAQVVNATCPTEK